MRESKWASEELRRPSDGEGEKESKEILTRNRGCCRRKSEKGGGIENGCGVCLGRFAGWRNRLPPSFFWRKEKKMLTPSVLRFGIDKYGA